MSSHTIEDLTSSILDFQANVIRVTYRRKTHFVDPVGEPSHLSALEYIWNASKLAEEQQPDGPYKWRKLGFATEDLSREFVEVGVLGLDCLVRPPFHNLSVAEVDSSRPETFRVQGLRLLCHGCNRTNQSPT